MRQGEKKWGWCSKEMAVQGWSREKLRNTGPRRIWSWRSESETNADMLSTYVCLLSSTTLKRNLLKAWNTTSKTRQTRKSWSVRSKDSSKTLSKFKPTGDPIKTLSKPNRNSSKRSGRKSCRRCWPGAKRIKARIKRLSLISRKFRLWRKRWWSSVPSYTLFSVGKSSTGNITSGIFRRLKSKRLLLRRRSELKIAMKEWRNWKKFFSTSKTVLSVSFQPLLPKRKKISICKMWSLPNLRAKVKRRKKMTLSYKPRALQPNLKAKRRKFLSSTFKITSSKLLRFQLLIFTLCPQERWFNRWSGNQPSPRTEMGS